MEQTRVREERVGVMFPALDAKGAGYKVYAVIDASGDPARWRPGRRSPAFVTRLAARTAEREPIAGPNVAQAQKAAFRARESADRERLETLRALTQPCLVLNGVLDTMIPVRNSYLLAEGLPNAGPFTYPDAGHSSLFPFHESFVQQAMLFLGGQR